MPLHYTAPEMQKKCLKAENIKAAYIYTGLCRELTKSEESYEGNDGDPDHGASQPAHEDDPDERHQHSYTQTSVFDGLQLYI